MSIIVIGSSESRAGRSLVAAAIAYRLARDGRPVTLVRMAGDESAIADAGSFAAIEGIASPGTPLSFDEVRAFAGDVVVEAPAGGVMALTPADRVIEVAGAASPPLDCGHATLAGRVLTRVPAAQLDVVRERSGVLAVLPEDRILAAPSVGDIAEIIDARWLAGEHRTQSVGRVMIGTVASDAAEPYFANREGTCVVTRFDKTDIQLAALQTDVRCLVITSGGAPSPYLMDRVTNSRDEVAVLAAVASTVDTVRAIEPLFGVSRFAGDTKLARAVELLDEAGFSLNL